MTGALVNWVNGEREENLQDRFGIQILLINKTAKLKSAI